MKTSQIVKRQLACISIYMLIGDASFLLLYYYNIITSSAFFWCLEWVPDLYRIVNVGLLGSAWLVALLSGKAEGNTIVVSDKSFSKTLLSLWQSLNTTTAIVSIASFSFLFCVDPQSVSFLSNRLLVWIIYLFPLNVIEPAGRVLPVLL